MDCTSEMRSRNQIKEKCGNRIIKVILEPVKLHLKSSSTSTSTQSLVWLSDSGFFSEKNSFTKQKESSNFEKQESESGQSEVSIIPYGDTTLIAIACSDSDEGNGPKVSKNKTSRHRRARKLKNYAKCVFSSSEESDADLESQPISKTNPKKSNLNLGPKTSTASVPSTSTSTGRSRIKSRTRNRKPKQSVTCEICGRKYSSVPILEHHILGNHVMDNPFECDVCFKAFISERKFTEHFQTHCNKSSTDFPYICSSQKCIFVCKTKNELKLHFSNTHINIANNEGSSHFCPFCDTLFENDTDFQHHLKVTTTLIECRICQESGDCERLELDTQCNLNRHIKEKHPNQKQAIVKTNTKINKNKDDSPTAGDRDVVQKCPVCTAHLPHRPDLTYQENLDKHRCWKLPSLPREPGNKNASLINTHHCDSRPVKLPKAKAGTKTSETSSDFRCLVCEVSFSRRSELNIHEKLEDHQRWKCPACPKLLKNKYSLKVHLATIHSDARPVKCEHAGCDKSFKNRRELLRHRVVHSGSRTEKSLKHKCGECAQSFMNPATLRQHLAKYHGGERPFECPQCPKAYATSWELRGHSSSHSDERPFPCKYCDKRYKSVREASSHMRKRCKNNESRLKSGTTQNREGPEQIFECHVCQKRFASTHRLKQHSAVHTDQRPFPCKFCDATYKALAETRRHQKKCQVLSPAERSKKAKRIKQVLKSLKLKRDKIVTAKKRDPDEVSSSIAATENCDNSNSSVTFSDTDKKFKTKQELESNSSDSDHHIFVEKHSMEKIMFEKVPKQEEEK